MAGVDFESDVNAANGIRREIAVGLA